MSIIQVLGRASRLIALADAEQRIYEFRGADPQRIGEFIKAFTPAQFDFAGENRRSHGTDIVAFGNDLLTGANKKRKYEDVDVIVYTQRKGDLVYFDLKIQAIRCLKRLQKLRIRDWSIAILVPSNRLMLAVSKYLDSEQRFANGKHLPALTHDVALETAGPALAASLIAGLLEGGQSELEVAHRFLLNLRTHIRGHKGDKAPNQTDLDLAESLHRFVTTGVVRGATRKQITDEALRIAARRTQLLMTGDPVLDWLKVRALLSESSANQIRLVADHSRYIRLLRRGAILRSSLADLWRTHGSYTGASSAVQTALLQEHFSASTRVWRGINLMTIHKSKAKEFDEVIIFEGRHHGRIVPRPDLDRDVAQSRLKLRVAITRAIRHATVMTPYRNVCELL